MFYKKVVILKFLCQYWAYHSLNGYVRPNEIPLLTVTMQYKLLLLMLFLSQSHLFHFITWCTTDAKKVSGSYLIYLFIFCFVL